jgi:hypothetical protein
MCARSGMVRGGRKIPAATPGVFTMSNRARSETRGFDLRRSDSGWPIPPAAPSTQHFIL